MTSFLLISPQTQRRKTMETEVIEVAQEVVAGAPKNDIWGMVIYCAIIFAIIYFFMVMPNKRRVKEYQKMLDNLKVGNKVMAAGIYGTIKKINEKTIDLEIAKGVVIEVSKNAVASVE
jgi:preprotein translocase subunit YajC